MARTNVYIDGFNLYYGALKGTPLRWLNLAALCGELLPGHSVQRIRYFTALVNSLPYDDDAPVRQGFYLRALATLPNLKIHLGHFLSGSCPMPLDFSGSNPEPRIVISKTDDHGESVRLGRVRLSFTPVDPFPTVMVLKRSEKGSDVNLATHLLADGFRGDYECAVVISNDSDLAEPVRVVRQELGLQIGVVNPHRLRHASPELVRYASFTKQLKGHTAMLRRCQFPPGMSDSAGTFRKPATW